MAVCVRAKRVTDPLGERLKARLYGGDYQKNEYSSSGSEHEADSSCLADLVHGFLEDDEAGTLTPETAEASEHDLPDGEVMEMLNELLNVHDRFRCLLLSQVSEAVDALSGFRSNRAAFRRSVTKRLRDSGYNAGLCKSKWESSGGLTAGNYAYIDVILREGSRETRYLIDVDFAGEFQIARPTGQYSRILQVLPRIFVGKPHELKQIICEVCKAAKKSLKARELHLPPWRKNRYMQAKWFGPFRRTVNQFPAGTSFPAKFTIDAVKYRSVGFQDLMETFTGKCREKLSFSPYTTQMDMV